MGTLFSWLWRGGGGSRGREREHDVNSQRGVCIVGALVAKILSTQKKLEGSAGEDRASSVSEVDKKSFVLSVDFDLVDDYGLLAFNTIQ